MDQTAFYGVVSAINFTLLGLWWVAVKDRSDLADGDRSFSRMAYFVSLQFVIPATVSLMAQVAPGVPGVWRWAFGLAGLAGIISVALLAREMAVRTAARLAPRAIAALGIPLYAVVAVVAFRPGIVADLGIDLTPIQAEGFLFSLLVFLGVQEAWFVHMTPKVPAVRGAHR